MVRRFASVPSTQDLAHQLGADGAAAGTVVVAEAQTGGRGTRGRTWIAASGGLWLSYLARPLPDAAPRLSLRVGLEVAESLAGSIGERVLLKWPNDLILRDGKLGGILTEARWLGERLAWVVVGVGINVANPLPVDLPAKASRVADLMPAAVPADFEVPVIEAIARAVAAPTPVLTAAELARFEALDWLRGKPIEWPMAGLADGISAEGHLMVRGPSGRSAVVAGPIAGPGLAPGGERT